METRSTAQLAGGLPQPLSVSYGFTSLDAGLAPRAQQSPAPVTGVVAPLHLPGRANPAATADAVTAARGRACDSYRHAEDEVVAPASHAPD